MDVRKVVVAGVITLATVLGSAGQAFATSKASLEKDGYKCSKASTNNIECTKAGAKTYNCDGTGKVCQTLGLKLVDSRSTSVTPSAIYTASKPTSALSVGR